MALIDGDDRAASVHAESDLRCAAMTPWTFRPFVKDHPDVAWACSTALVKRDPRGAGARARFEEAASPAVEGAWQGPSFEESAGPRGPRAMRSFRRAVRSASVGA